MKKINLVIYLAVAVVIIAISIAGVFVYFYKTKVAETNKTAVNENANVNNLNSEPAFVAPSKIPEYVQDNIRRIFGEDTKIAITEEQKEEMKKDKNSLWVLNIPLKSIQYDLIITQEPWMLSMDIYDKQLTEFEEAQKKDIESGEGETRYTAILNRDDLSTELIAKLEGSIKLLEQNKLYLEKDKQRLLSVLKLIDERLANYGYGGLFIESNVTNIRNNSNQTIGAIEDISRITDLLINVKNGTIKHIKDKNALMTLYSADDEDTVSLVLFWHEEGYQKLRDQGVEIFDKLKSQLPTEL